MTLAPHFAVLLGTGFIIAFLHAALPTHWLPFVLVGRGQHWRAPKTLGIAAVAGLCHVLSTIAIGAIITGAGLAIEAVVGRNLSYIVGGVVIALGLYYLLDRRHHHAHLPSGRSDKAAIAGLFMLLTLSPCETILPVYLSDLKLGWSGFLVISAAFLVGTVAAMTGFTALSLAGASKLNLEKLEHYERPILGCILILLGIAVMILEH